MTRVLFWKELREQAAVVIALVALGIGLLAANVVINPNSGGTRSNDIGRFAVILLTMAAGVVIGGTLFAGEREQKTFGYLNRLPGTRRAVWPRKLLPGVVLTGVSAGLLWAAGAAFGTLGDAKEVTVWAIVLGAMAVGSLGWGSVGSTRGTTSIGASGQAIAYAVACFCAAILAALALEIALALVVGQRELTGWVRGSLPGVSQGFGPDALFGLPAAAFALFILPYPLSYWLYTRPDRERGVASRERLPEAASGRRGALAAPPVRPKRASGASSRSRMAWLVARQFAPGALALWALAPLLGLTLLIPEFVIPVALVAIGTLLGLFAAVAVWQDEQTSEANRFWGERRIPAARVWLWKSAAGLVFCLVAGVLAALPAVLAAVVAVNYPNPVASPQNGFGTGLFTDGYPFFTMLFLGPVTGFAFGQLAAMLFRKAVVAIAVGTMVAGVFSAIWLPSIADGGLHAGLAFAPAVVALLTARLLAWSWAGDTVGSARSVIRLVGGLTAALLTVGAGLAVRAFEVDAGPDPDADIAFAATLPTTDVEHAGRVLRSAAIRRVVTVEQAAARAAVLDGSDPRDSETPLAELAAESDWQRLIEQVAGTPVAVLEDPNEYYYDTRPRYLSATAVLLEEHLALGLRAQTRGDPADFVKRFGEVLACVRLVRSKTFLEGHLAARAIEVRTYAALGHWLARLGERPELLAMAQSHLANHAAAPYDTRDPLMARQTVARRSLAAPGQWLPRFLNDPQGYQPPESRREPSKRAAAEAEFLGLMWAFPWEQERLRRVVASGNAPSEVGRRWEAVRGLSPAWVLVPYKDREQLASHVEAIRTSVEAYQQLALAALALRRYHADHGAFPLKFASVVPKYLPRVPPTLAVNSNYYVDLLNRFPYLATHMAPNNASIVPFRYGVVPTSRVFDLDDPTGGRTPELSLPVPYEEAEAIAAVTGGIATVPPAWLTAPGKLPRRRVSRSERGDVVVIYDVVSMTVPKPAAEPKK